MTATQSNLAGLSRYIFRAPSWYASLAFALIIAAIAGVGAFDSGAADGTWRGIFFIGQDAWEGIFFIGVPTVVASFATTGVDRFVGGRLTPNRSSLLALAGEILIVAVLAVAALVAVVTPLEEWFMFDALVIALASVFALRLLVIMAVSRSSLLIAAIPASIQTLVAAVLLFVYSGTLTRISYVSAWQSRLLPYLIRSQEAPTEIATSAVSVDDFLLLGVTCTLYAGGVYAFLQIVDRPWRRSLGVSVLDFLRGFIGHIAEGSRELEDFFEQMGEDAIVPVTVLSFRRRDAEDDASATGAADGNTSPGGAEKARIVLPMIHPGPMGEIGGGNFPERVARRSDGLAFPPHATAGHDFNLVTEREVDTILDAAESAYERIEYAADATTSVAADAGEATVLGQGFGDDAMLISTYAPNFADDVEYSVGLSASAEARATGLDEVLLVDAHNSNDGLSGPDLGHVTPGSARSFDMIEAAGLAGEALADAERGELSLGAAWRPTDWTPAEGIGPLGIRVAVTEVADRVSAYVLIDGNNMEPGLRDRILDALEAVDAAEVMTTDTHIVNTVEADNQVGAALDQDELIATVRELVAEALDDREPVVAGMETERATVTVFGNDRTETLASQANVAISMGGALAVAVVLVMAAVSGLVFLLASV